MTLRSNNDFEKRRDGAKVMPGPKGAPIIGNLRQIPAVKLWVALKQWGDQYGEFLLLLTSSRRVCAKLAKAYLGFLISFPSLSLSTGL